MMIYVKGEYIEEKEGSVCGFDDGFVYGMGVLERFRSVGGEVLVLDWDVERVNE
ncbi:hypothetical protein [Bacillus sp. WP8]|uniref:hypothetical protein n=1 Tax=Bacillus sp. WP8 TaxID=756828 RepID=UPI0016427F77|nr:hypothetical protein [Bacillus sp. WP8]